jgi:beta-fructofuranosidase
MALHITDKWVWDFWLAQDGPDYHLFFLQADRSLQEESLRHWHVSVGHAVSQDLRAWTLLPDAIRPSGPPAPGETEAFDSKTTWTGSVIPHDGLWYMFYTGSRLSEKGLVQHIGLATSDDLLTWTKHPANPLIEADPRWYELLDLDSWHDQAWRDPWVFQHPTTGQFHSYITGRAKDGPADARGVIAHARSDNLIDWEVLPPLDIPPGEFGHMEVPQLLQIAGRWYLIFSCPHTEFSNARRARPGAVIESGTHYLVGDDPLGPFHYLDHKYMVGDAHGSLYSGKLVQNPAGAWVFLAFHNFTADGAFVGDLADPMPVTVSPDGRLHVDTGG